MRDPATGEKHIADVVVDNVVLEFQHSPISCAEIESREAFYTSQGYTLLWILDGKSWVKNVGINGSSLSWHKKSLLLNFREPIAIDIDHDATALFLDSLFSDDRGAKFFKRSSAETLVTFANVASVRSALKTNAVSNKIAIFNHQKACSRVDSSICEAARVEAARVEAAKVKSARVEAAKVKAAEVEAAKVETAKAIQNFWELWQKYPSSERDGRNFALFVGCDIMPFAAKFNVLKATRKGDKIRLRIMHGTASAYDVCRPLEMYTGVMIRVNNTRTYDNVDLDSVNPIESPNFKELILLVTKLGEVNFSISSKPLDTVTVGTL
jgi:hypothetical protein